MDTPQETRPSPTPTAGRRPRPARGRGTATPPEPVAIQRVPWSQLGPGFARAWGRPRGQNEPEHLEILGPTGSGKGYFLVTVLKDRVRVRDTSVVYIVTKPADKTAHLLGWPIVKDWRGVQQHEQVIFWPRTAQLGAARKAYQERAVRGLLDRLWVPESNTVVVFDEINRIEKLSTDVREIVQMYYQEGRSQGITVVAGKQRPQGVDRDMHSETAWKVAFTPFDEDDAERVAELFGARREWVPVLMDLDKERREFVIQHKITGDCYISWIDVPLPTPEKNKSGGYRK